MNAIELADRLETHDYPNDTIIFEASATLRQQAKEIEQLKENPNFIVTLQNKIEKQEIEIKKLNDKLGIQNHSDNQLLKAVSKIKKQAKEIEQLKEKNEAMRFHIVHGEHMPQMSDFL